MITYQVESWSAVWREMMPLWEEHYREVALNQDEIKLDPDIAMYNAMDALGTVHVVVARDAGRMVGYHISFVRPHLHYRQSLSAITDVYFLRSSHRGPRAAIRLFDAVEKTLGARGVQKLFNGTKIHKSPDGRSLDHGRLFEHMGHVEAERLYVKVIRN